MTFGKALICQLPDKRGNCIKKREFNVRPLQTLNHISIKLKLNRSPVFMLDDLCSKIEQFYLLINN